MPSKVSLKSPRITTLSLAAPASTSGRVSSTQATSSSAWVLRSRADWVSEKAAWWMPTTVNDRAPTVTCAVRGSLDAPDVDGRFSSSMPRSVTRSVRQTSTTFWLQPVEPVSQAYRPGSPSRSIASSPSTSCSTRTSGSTCSISSVIMPWSTSLRRMSPSRGSAVSHSMLNVAKRMVSTGRPESRGVPAYESALSVDLSLVQAHVDAQRRSGMDRPSTEDLRVGDGESGRERSAPRPA